MLQDFEVSHVRLFVDDNSLINETDDFHLAPALGAGKRINLPHLLYALTPLWWGDLLWPRLRHINYFNCCRNLGRVCGSLFSFLPFTAATV